MEYAKFAILTVMMTLAAQTYGTFPALVNLVDSAVKTVLPAVESICPKDGKDNDNTDNSNNDNNSSTNNTNSNNGTNSTNNSNNSNPVQTLVNGVLGGTQPSNTGTSNNSSNSTAENSTTEKTPESSLIDQTAELLKQSINTMGDTAKKNVDTMAKEAKKAATTWNDFMKGFMPKK